MKPLKILGMTIGLLAMCAAFAAAGSVLSHSRDHVQASSDAATKSKLSQARADIQAAAVASAQETTDLTQ